MEGEIVKQIRQPPAMLGLLDFCKGIAIVWVMLVHAIHGWFGWQGVHVFIVLGGFALTYACLTRENQLTWSQWFQRRAARILPAYWLVAAFIMGNKRSGATLVTDLLNSHPNVFRVTRRRHRLDSFSVAEWVLEAKASKHYRKRKMN